MIRIECEQGTKAWLDAKLGVPSASNFHRILTPSTMKFSKSSAGYCHELIAEQLIGAPLDDATTGFMQRGSAVEHEALSWYELQRNVDVEQVGFLLRDDGRIGCSPDGLVGDDGDLEIKVLNAKNHIGVLLDGIGDDYRCQQQGRLLITGRRWSDLVCYHPTFPSVLIRVERDEKFIAALDEAIARFLSYLDESKLKLQRQYGLFPTERIPALRIA